MRVVLQQNTDPAFNLAFEEYALTRWKEGVVAILWRNERSVIIGRNQNAYAEIDLDYVAREQIAVIRRLTGGGAVFHDLGNINFTFLSDYEKGQFGSYQQFAKPVCDFLKTLGLTAEVSGRNDILADGVKISGNAQTVQDGRILQHGTLLYSADLSRMAAALRPRPLKMQSRGIRSVRSRVGNIQSLCNCALTAQDFLQQLYLYLLQMPDAEAYIPTEQDNLEVERLRNEKYGRWEWNFGQSPNMNFTREEKYPFGLLQLTLSVHGGRIANVLLQGDFFGLRPVEELCAALENIPYERKALCAALETLQVEEYVSGMKMQDLIELLGAS